MAEEKGKQAAGEKKGRKPWTLRELGGKPIWDWLQLIGVLAIPVVLALGGCMFNAQQNIRQQAVEQQRAQEATLQAYLGQMSELLLDRKLLRSEPDSAARRLARAQTLTVLPQLDHPRRRIAFKFLLESFLIQRGVYFDESDMYFDEKAPQPFEAKNIPTKPPVISLKDLKLDNVNLIGSHLLLGADLENVGMNKAKLDRAVLTNADLTRAHLEGADFTNARLEGVNFTNAHLEGADFTNANLDGADFTNAKGVTSLQLHQEAESLKSATMPGTQKYEAWQKDREARRKDK